MCSTVIYLYTLHLTDKTYSLMKKIILLTIALSLSLTALQAQIRFGAKAGLNTTGTSGSGLKGFIDDNIVGFYVGPTAEMTTFGKIRFDLSALYSQKGIKFKGEETHRTNYIEIPLNAKYFIPLHNTINVFAAAGPYISFRISGDKHFDAVTEQIRGQWEAKSFGAGLNFSAGFEVNSMLQLGATYGLGLTDSYKSRNIDLSGKERVWSFFASVYF